MDKQFLEFLGHFFTQAAQGQKQMDEMAKWMGQALKGTEIPKIEGKGLDSFGELTDMFMKFYKSDHQPQGTTDALKTWENAAEAFRRSFQDYLNLMGVVPREKYLALEKKYKDLEKTAAQQVETIEKLRRLLGKNGTADKPDMAGDFQELMEKQTKQFQELTESFGQFFQNKETKD